VLKILLSLSSYPSHQQALHSRLNQHHLPFIRFIILIHRPGICSLVFLGFRHHSNNNSRATIPGSKSEERIGELPRLLCHVTSAMAANQRINVLVYAGPGSTSSSVHHATWSLRRLLEPTYAVLTVTGSQLLSEPWTSSCALLVMPGGADLGYCRTLNGEGNRRLKQYVSMGGKYLGLCAGGYYGCARCEWEVGRKGMEVVGERELGWYPGVCRGLAFAGFEYHSEAGTRAAEVNVNRGRFGTPVPDSVRLYYNGGGVFVDAEKFQDRGVEVLASYVDELDVGSGEGNAAVVYCKVGDGAVVLTGPHPEYVLTLTCTSFCLIVSANHSASYRFSGLNLSATEPTGHSDYASVVAALVADDKKRTDFMKGCLAKLGLQVSPDTQAVPSLSPLHLSSMQHGEVAELVDSWCEAGIISVSDDGNECIKGENDTFVLEQADRLDMEAVKYPLLTADAQDHGQTNPTDHAAATDGLIDYNALPKHLLAHLSEPLNDRLTPSFNHAAFYTALASHRTEYNHRHPPIPGAFGKTLLYGKVVTSTSTLLEKNPTLLSHLPTGLTATATTQVAGRGRGTNVWVSPPGSLMFSTVLRHSLSLSSTAPVVFVQYLAAMAVVAGIKNYDTSAKAEKAYRDLPIKLKWPNDVYALDPSALSGEAKYVKIGGILVNSSYAGGDYTLVVGIGLNVSNTSGPTTSLAHIAAKHRLPPFQLERLLAAILTQFEGLYATFCRQGWSRELQAVYYADWLHRDQIVTLETEGGARARIKGITEDWGLLVAEELGWEDRPTGKVWSLQSDSNSFDFFKGLLKRKV